MINIDDYTYENLQGLVDDLESRIAELGEAYMKLEDKLDDVEFDCAVETGRRDKRIAELKSQLEDVRAIKSGWAYQDELETENTELHSHIAELSQALGLITTLKPTMVMDVDHPLDMAKEVEAYVTARITELEAENKLLADSCEILRKQTNVLFRQVFSDGKPEDK